MPETLTLVDPLFSIVTFIILLLLLRKFAWGPMMNMMQEREEKIADDIDTAENNRLESEKYLEQQKLEVDRAREEAQSIIESAKKTGEQQGREIVEQSRRESEQVKENALAQIQNEKEQAIAELREQVSTLSVMIATKIIEKELDEAEQEKLIEEYLQEAGGNL
ncbi:ATP synthase F0 subcomplex B subunit [Sinobaca qinghaiensis]|uniref:ATP synthase subunit b n=1 Tax=Sinobaca qinghaiensis TaxID=342944 RepID=A0A419V809_9BACL|nr:F0F1 ATP synthase subunit B [Sinobaca qinghaiensis]RKD76088.1 ATP synthase F0 subcomplex B subunit [Sinobaca qinghaiensis]